MHLLEILRSVSRAGAAALSCAVVLGAAPAALGAGDAASVDSPPVLLRDTIFFTPVETAGTGLAPEVRVRVTVDERGRVRDPQVLSIEPSSRYDELFRERIVETLRTWRYAPARAAGEPVETTLSWAVQFVARSGQPAPGTVGTPSALEEEARLTQVFTLPPDQQAERLRNFASVAEGRLDPDHRRRIDSARFTVVSDAADEPTVRTVAGNLEAVFGLLEQTLGTAIEPQPAHYKLIVYLFSREASFHGVAQELTAPEWTTGLYAPPGLLTFHLETPSVELLLGTMIHEVVHAYTDQHLSRPGFRPPPWLSEGLAEYFGKSEIRKGVLEPGRIREGKYVLDQIRGGAYRRTTSTGWTLDEAQRAVRSGRAVSIPELVGIGRDTFYGEDVSMHYALSWLLVHYLRHGEPEWAEREFPDFLLYVSEGYSAVAALDEVYGLRPAELEERFRTYVRSL